MNRLGSGLGDEWMEVREKQTFGERKELSENKTTQNNCLLIKLILNFLPLKLSTKAENYFYRVWPDIHKYSRSPNNVVLFKSFCYSINGGGG